VHVLPSVGQDLTRVGFGAVDLGQVRHHVTDLVNRWIPDRVDDAVLAVHEVAANTIVHGGGVGLLRVWATATELVFDVVDSKAERTVPTVTRPSADDLSGRGLWLAESLMDSLTVTSSPTSTTVRMRMRLPHGTEVSTPLSASGMVP
jgi:anti-sigma regulatory factor (Ser/Thr protein kinase)